MSYLESLGMVMEGSGLEKVLETVYGPNTVHAIFKESRTAKLWVQYVEHADIVKDFILAERRRNWMEHLVATGKMLNLYAAAGLNNYAKSTCL